MLGSIKNRYINDFPDLSTKAYQCTIQNVLYKVEKYLFYNVGN